MPPHKNNETAAKEARAWAKKVLAGLRTKEVVTVADACRYYEENRRREKPNSKAANEADRRFKRLVYPHAIAYIKLAKLCSADLKAWRAEMKMEAISKDRYQPR